MLSVAKISVWDKKISYVIIVFPQFALSAEIHGTIVKFVGFAFSAQISRIIRALITSIRSVLLAQQR